jgi:glycosyltransferase involved in cell wall biosynthesis
MEKAENNIHNRTIGIVIPLFNEALNLPKLVERLESTMEGMSKSGYAFEVVFVDDHSTDETSAMVKQLLYEKPWLGFVRLSRNCGSYTALAAGLRYCSADCAILMAADLQDPPDVIPQLVAKWREGFEVVWAVRTEREGESRITKFLAEMFYWLMRHMVLAEIPSKGSDFLLMDRKAIDAYNSIPEKHTSFLAMVLWMGFRQAFISYVKQTRYAGRSKWTLSKKLKLFVDSIISFSYAPIRVMSLFGFGMALCGFAYACVVVVFRLCGWVVAGTGFAALMTVLLVGQGSILIMLGILGEYLWRTFDEARGRPRYIIEERLDSKHTRRQSERTLEGEKSVTRSSIIGSEDAADNQPQNGVKPLDLKDR